jgi:CRP-like cAMP-binding protein/HEAT repeat protein
MSPLERALKIQSGERQLVLLMVAFFAVVQMSHGLAANTADALFFQGFGVSLLPTMILTSGPVVMIFILGHGAGLASMENARWLRRLMLVCAAWAALEWVASLAGWRTALPVIWVSTQVIIMLTFTAMWNAAGSSVTTRQAKRLFPIFATAGIAGGVIGNLVTGPLAGALGTANLLLVQTGLLLCGFGLLFGLGHHFAPEDRMAPGSVMTQVSATARTIRSSRLLRLCVIVAGAISCLFYLVYFPFSEQVASSFSTDATMASFLGVFASIATATTFVVSLFLTNRLFARFGIVISLLLVPIVYVGGFATWLVVFTLSSAAIVRGLQWVATNAIGGTAFTALFNVVPGRRRAQIVTFMTAVPAQIGTTLAGGLLILTTSAPRWVLFVAGLLVAGIALVSVISLRSAYVDALVATVRSGMPAMFDVAPDGLFTPTDADAIRVLAEHLDDPRPEARALAVAWLSQLGGKSTAPKVEQMLGDASPQVRAAAFDSMCLIEPERISRHTTTALADEVPEIRLHALGYMRRNPDADAQAVGHHSLSDADPRVRAAAAALIGGEEGQAVIDELLQDPDPRFVAAALIEIAAPDVGLDADPAPFLESDNAAVREAAVRVVAGRGGEVGPLAERLDDRSSRVRSAAATSLAGTNQGMTRLMEVLESGSVVASDAALHAVTPLETPSEAFVRWAAAEATRAARLADDARAIDVFPRSAAHDYLIRVLAMRSSRLVGWVLTAMTTRHTETVMPVVSRGVRSTDPEIQAQALEALERLGARSVTAVLLPLLEETPDPSHDSRVALEELAEDFDPWLRALATVVLVELTGADMPSLVAMPADDLTAALDPMERVLILQGAQMFSELDPEDLDLIARSAIERTYEPEESIFVSGEQGDEMLLIVRGDAVVTVGTGPGRRIIQTYGSGQPVGELALLSGERRAADVTAGEEGVMALVLSYENLLSVLEERPVVAMGMLGTLARRLIDQTGRLNDGAKTEER